LAPLGAIEVGDGIELGRRLWKAGEEAGLGQRQLARGLAEIGLRRRLDPIGPIAVVNPIEIGLEDLCLRVLMLDLDREDRLVQLAQDRPIFREVEVLDELLRDRAAALVETQMQQVIQAGLARAQQVQTAVLIKATVLDGDGRLLHRRRDLLQWYDAAPLGALVDLRQQDGPCPVVDAGRERQAGGAEIGGRGEAGPHVQQARKNDEEDSGEQDGGSHHPGAKAQAAPSGGGSATARAVAAVGLDRVAAVRAERTNVVDGLHYTKRLTNYSRWAPRTPLR